jgi:hypothetical protein
MQNTKIMCAVMLDTKVRASAPGARGARRRRRSRATAAQRPQLCAPAGAALAPVACAGRGAPRRRGCRPWAPSRPSRAPQGPEIRTGMLVDAKPIQLTSGQVRAAARRRLARRVAVRGPEPRALPGRRS